MSDIYQRFLKYIPENGYILDAGCGSGRDSLYFLNNGYKVLSFDNCKEMVEQTTNLTGQKALQMSFYDVDFENMFDGVWACASLLHIPKRDMPSILEKLRRTLKPGGILYCSFKWGDSEVIREDGRFFNNYTEELFRELINKCVNYKIIEIWRSTDVRKDRNDLWLNSVLRSR